MPHWVGGVGYDGRAPLLAVVGELGEATSLAGLDGHLQVRIGVEEHALLQAHRPNICPCKHTVISIWFCWSTLILPHHATRLTWQSEADQFTTVFSPWLVLHLAFTSHLMRKTANKRAAWVYHLFFFWLHPSGDKFDEKLKRGNIREGKDEWSDSSWASVFLTQLERLCLRSDGVSADTDCTSATFKLVLRPV